MAELSPGERALGDLLDHSHSLRPDQLPAHTAATAVGMGATDAVIHLADIEQRVLVPFGREGSALDNDGTVAGRAYRQRETVESVDERRVWVPLLDGADRIGVLAVAVDAPLDDALRARLRWLASLVASLVVSKGNYGDQIVVTRRTKPVTLAAELRWALLPPLTFRNEHVEIAAMLEPAHEVAGDAFDYSVGAGAVHAAMFDAMGHGLEATRMANLAIAAYRHTRRQGADVATMVRRIDEVLTGEFGSERFVTGLLVHLDLSTGDIELTSCGHPLPLLLRGRQLITQVQGPTNIPLGLGVGDPSSIRLPLEVGDRLLLFTDGVTDAQDADGELFGVGRLGELLTHAAMADELPAETVRRLTHSVLEHAAALRDDASLLMLGWPKPLDRQ